MNKISYPLTESVLEGADINAAIKVLRSKKITMGPKTRQVEAYFNDHIVKTNSLMVNSGSSANLLIFQCLINPMVKKLKPGDEVLIPAICWSTSLWPIIQSGLKVKFVDIDLSTLNIDLNDLIKKITKRTKALMLVHALGNCTDMTKLMNICKKNKIILIEDTCESLGTKYKNKYLGTFGEFSSFSFYSSHQISSGEGGMICCKDKNDYNIIKSLRSHGWSRGTSYENKIYKKNKFLDKKFIFFNSGYNLRPTEISAAIGLSQFKKLDEFIKLRKINRKKIISAMNKSNHIKDKLDFFAENLNVNPSWFGIPIKIVNNKIKKNILIKKLEKNGIETRPIISGNFAKQPAAIKYGLAKNQKFPNTDDVYNKSFFIGLPTKHIKNNFIDKIILAFEKSL